MELALAGSVFVAAVTLTYFFCIRPMRQGGHCAMTPRAERDSAGGSRCATGTDQDAAIASLRKEIEELKSASSEGSLPVTQRQAAEPQTRGQ